MTRTDFASLFQQHPRPPLEGEDRGEGGPLALTLPSPTWEEVQNVLRR
jgi:hypothetical protein